jgi:hypothetical protein
MINEKKDALKQKFEEADDSLENSEVMPISPPAQVLDAQDNLEEPEGEETIVLRILLWM